VGAMLAPVHHYFTDHPVKGSETRHYARLTVHCLSPITLEEENDKARTPQSRGFDLIHPASTRPRPGLDAQHGSTGKEGQYGSALRVTSPSRPLRHRGVQGWSSIPRARRHSHLNRDRQDTPCHTGRLSPYKRAGRGTPRKRTTTRDEHSKAPSQRSTSQAIILVLFFTSFETWARSPLSQACNPYTSTSVQGNT
jgi:hypothetical protein